MMREEPVAGDGIVLGVAAQGLDEAGERGQGRAQLVAGVGQEIDAHALRPARVGLVAQHHERAPLLELAVVLAGLAQRPGPQPPGPVLGAAAISKAALRGMRP